MGKANPNLGRRDFLKSAGIATVSLVAAGAGIGYVRTLHAEDSKHLLRPPGARAEEDFIYACIKCGLCVQICPIEAVKLADIDHNLSYGTPYIDAREQACDFSCGALQCTETCPTSALNFYKFKDAGEAAIMEYVKDKPDAYEDRNFNPIHYQADVMHKEVKMGIAKLNPASCLAVQGKGFKGSPRGADFKGVYLSVSQKDTAAYPVNEHQFDREICDLCVTECPIGDTAIRLEKTENGYIPKVLDGCTGCGVCEMVCPTATASIVIIPKNKLEEEGGKL
jgi:ferredoxin-type protein NapG